MMLNWLKNIFYDKEDKQLNRLKGRAICSICNKNLKDNIFTIYGDKRYFCKKHAKERLRGLHVNKKVINPLCDESKNNYYVCQSCDKKLMAWEKHYEFCTNCYSYYCKEHFKNHLCEPKRYTKRQDKSINPFSGKCFFCKDGITKINSYSCKYCKNWFCEEHRLPEHHECKGKPRNPHRTGGRIIYHKGIAELIPK